MSEHEHPPRLIDDPEVGKALRAARDEAMSPAQLAANARALDTRLANLPAPGRFPIGNGALTLAAVAAVVVLARLIAGPALFGGESLPTMTPAVPAMSPATTATPVAVVTATIVTPVANPALAPTTAVPLGTPVPTPSPTPAVGTLADELRLYDEAQDFAKSGEHLAALSSLDDLARRFPKSSLAPEAAITRAEVLVAAGKNDEAAELLSRLVTEPAHAGRRAELLRTLGDVERARGKCDIATTRYREALAAGAAGEEASAARRGLGSCQATE